MVAQIDAAYLRQRWRRLPARLIAYGAFRLLHEPLRATPRVVWEISPYQLLALAALVLGVVRWRQRARVTSSDQTAPPPHSVGVRES